MNLPALTGPQMAEVDRVMMGDLGLDVLQVMEVAGRQVASFARARFLGGDAFGKRIVVLCGNGGNGGDGMVAARHLAGWGAAVSVFLGRLPKPGQGVAAHQLEILHRIGVPVTGPDAAPTLPAADLLIDGLLGFSLTASPAGETAALIRAANAHRAPILAIDVPSGLNATTSEVYDPCIRAAATLTLALPKTGLLVPSAAPVTGDLHVTDIGVPLGAYARLGHEVGPIFASAEIIRVR